MGVGLDFECVVVGAGVVGLAVAAELARGGMEVLILEAESGFGTVTSARNSEVIHAGIYYRPGSLKALHCVQGKHALYRYCEERFVDHRRCGKLIVATTSEQLSRLAEIRANAAANGVDDLKELDTAAACAMEPELDCCGALFSPSTGIIDSHHFMLSLLGDAENHGATLVNDAVVASAEFDALQRTFRICVDHADEPLSLTSRYLVNAAGHGACAIASTIRQLPEKLKPQPVYSKGNYFRLNGRAPFSHLVYPVPEQGGLGVHITIDLAGMARFGPDVEPVEAVNYQVDPDRSHSFYAAIRRYWPALADGSLEPDYAGIRPRIMYKGALYDDFLIQDAGEHGLPGLVNLFSIESPGLTASLSIAQAVAAAVKLNH